MSAVKPLGGTELLSSWLHDALPNLCDQVQIILSRPEEVELENKPRVLWLHDLPHDPASQSLRDPSYRTQFNRIVFVSHWQQQQYNLFLGIPYSQGVVIKNAVPHRETPLPKSRENGKLRFAYTSTPHRGLAVVAAAADALAQERQDWELHVYSSLNLYGWAERDKSFEPLYDKLRENPCVVYHGTQSNETVREALDHTHIHVYPSLYAETSCLAIQEALMAGCLCITSNYGALPETCGEWAWMFQYDERPEVMANRTLQHMKQALDHYDNEQIQNALRVQSVYYQQFYSFQQRVVPWTGLLNAVIAEGAPVQKLVIE
jgi:glycosyltransferase involved in cell wall biosynthesis